MLTHLSIVNFQCHEVFSTDLESVTCFVGKSNSGKSTILRAIEWAALNKPAGDAFISWDKEFAKAKLVVDSCSIVRKKGKGENSYKLDKAKYVSFHSDVPDAIAQTLNIDERNFSNQHSSPFWLSLSAGQVSKELNEIIDLGVIDGTLANIAKEMRTAKAKEAVIEERLKAAKDVRNGLSWVVKAKEEMDGLIGRKTTLDQNVTALAKLTEIIQNVKMYVEGSQVLAETILCGLRLCITGSKAIGLAKRVRSLETTLEKARDIIAVMRIRLPLGKLAVMGKKVEEKRKEVRGLEAMMGEGGNTVIRMARLNNEVIIAKKELEGKMSGICPVCNREIE